LSKLSFEQFAILKLLLDIEGIGPSKLKNLLNHFRSFNKIISATLNQLIEVEGIERTLALRISSSIKNLEQLKKLVAKELDRLTRMDCKVLTIWDADYPELLKKIFDPPLILYYKGFLSENDKYSIAIVGTRQPTNYGKSFAEKFSSQLAEQSISIVSGMARGIDSIAHKAALKSSGRTIAVIGTGLDIVYPPENKKLFDEISEKGLVLSEYKLGTKPDAQNFPKRNRIISGLSLGTLIIETGLNGGAMQTASFALDQNREVFALPGNVGIKQSEGTNGLIQKGEAKLVIEADDILNELELKLKPVVGKNIPKPSVELNIFEEKILSTLSTNPIHIDTIASISSMSTSDCLVYLLSLEFKNLVKQLPGKMFSLT